MPHQYYYWSVWWYSSGWSIKKHERFIVEARKLKGVNANTTNQNVPSTHLHCNRTDSATNPATSNPDYRLELSDTMHGNPMQTVALNVVRSSDWLAFCAVLLFCGMSVFSVLIHIISEKCRDSEREKCHDGNYYGKPIKLLVRFLLAFCNEGDKILVRMEMLRGDWPILSIAYGCIAYSFASIKCAFYVIFNRDKTSTRTSI